MAKHWHVSLDYIVNGMPVAEWWPCLIAALEAEEMEFRRGYWGKAEDYVPFFAPDEAPLLADERQPFRARINAKILALGQRTGAVRGSLEGLAQVRPDLAQKVFVDEAGAVVDAEGKTVAVPAGTVVVDGQGALLEAQAALRKPLQLDDVLAALGMGVKEEGAD